MTLEQLIVLSKEAECDDGIDGLRFDATPEVVAILNDMGLIQWGVTLNRDSIIIVIDYMLLTEDKEFVYLPSSYNSSYIYCNLTGSSCNSEDHH